MTKEQQEAEIGAAFAQLPRESKEQVITLMERIIASRKGGTTE